MLIYEQEEKWLLPIMIVLVASLALTGCTDDMDNSVDDTAKDVEDSARDMNYEDITVTPEQAFDKFMELHPDTKITQIDLDKELMEYQYVVEGYDNENSYEVKINPVDSSVISDDSEVYEMDDEEDAEITKDHLAKIESIIDKAKVEDGSDSELDEWNISVEDGKVIIDIEIGATEYSYDMDTEELVEGM